ncbi:hypothetical protein JOD57_002141 [Geodermatophilus bullaregiensis]|uniref:hypothetical protein n=1 Tax=Geodermatophilus bullaregiensis TaxID=1564160 RepID=UPI0019594DEE|nr:hypothetical protein [Geodermatophilus bullaregiensis]MBM7806304.1 hypothetical protein [Geodermatophilus bullaregiensis]
MTEPENSGYNDSPATSDPDGDLVDGTPGHDRGDGGEKDTVTLTTDDEAQRDDLPIRGGNEAG